MLAHRDLSVAERVDIQRALERGKATDAAKEAVHRLTNFVVRDVDDLVARVRELEEALRLAARGVRSCDSIRAHLSDDDWIKVRRALGEPEVNDE
jgi:hypothetical protein